MKSYHYFPFVTKTDILTVLLTVMQRFSLSLIILWLYIVKGCLVKCFLPAHDLLSSWVEQKWKLCLHRDIYLCPWNPFCGLQKVAEAPRGTHILLYKLKLWPVDDARLKVTYTDGDTHVCNRLHGYPLSSSQDISLRMANARRIRGKKNSPKLWGFVIWKTMNICTRLCWHSIKEMFGLSLLVKRPYRLTVKAVYIDPCLYLYFAGVVLFIGL